MTLKKITKSVVINLDFDNIMMIIEPLEKGLRQKCLMNV